MVKTASILPIPNFVKRDPYLNPHLSAIQQRLEKVQETKSRLIRNNQSLTEFASGHEYYGLHFQNNSWVFREWAPNANKIVLYGTFTAWKIIEDYALKKISPQGVWEIILPAHVLKHGDLFRLHMEWPSGSGDRVPAWARRAVQDEQTKIWSTQVWNEPYQWQHLEYRRPSEAPLIYEAHVGMAQEEGKTGTYNEFRQNVLPRIAKAGYNTIQLMAVQEHPYYGSFGYQVSGFFAASSRFGTPSELKALIDEAHHLGLSVIMDLVHSHAVKNEIEGLGRFDGTVYQYFHAGPRGLHPAWGTYCFDYSKPEVLHFLLSNCRYWLDEYHFDGFRFDGVTSMLYSHHGLGRAFTSYDFYFDESVDLDAFVYLSLAHEVIQSTRPDAITVAEDVSGMPGLATSIADGGVGFNYRLAMGTPDYWIKLLKEKRDEDWNVSWLWSELTNRRSDEKTISYAESHDQALVGDKTVMFWLADKEMYTHMRKSDQSLVIDRAIALHKIIRLITLATAGHGYLNFMGNEFGHPEWIDFPREGNNWSYHYARRQWSLRDNKDLRFSQLAEFDQAMIKLARAENLLDGTNPKKLFEHVEQHLLMFERSSLFFAFNLDPKRSFENLEVQGLPNGVYTLALNSDDPRFGGFGNVAATQRYECKGNSLKLYLPARTALVLTPS